jgi:hypothetical protein
MFGWLGSLLSFLLGLWLKIPEETRDDIKEEIIKWFEEIFRKYYKSEKSKTEEKEHV